MYAENSLLKLVTLVLIHYHSTIEEKSLIMHKVYAQYANMILFKKEHKNTSYYENCSS